MNGDGLDGSKCPSDTLSNGSIARGGQALRSIRRENKVLAYLGDPTSGRSTGVSHTGRVVSRPPLFLFF